MKSIYKNRIIIFLTATLLTLAGLVVSLSITALRLASIFIFCVWLFSQLVIVSGDKSLSQSSERIKRHLFKKYLNSQHLIRSLAFLLVIQSKIAIGSGGLFGKGFLNGSQSYLDYLPEKHTDFIFTLFSEEFGFFGSLFILLLYAVILSRIIRIGHMTRSNFGKLYCYSFATAFFIYVAVNMMMVLGLLPIVGSPLPIMSYGGSSMMAIMLGLGIAMSCKIHKDVPVN